MIYLIALFFIIIIFIIYIKFNTEFFGSLHNITGKGFKGKIGNTKNCEENVIKKLNENPELLDELFDNSKFDIIKSFLEEINEGLVI